MTRLRLWPLVVALLLIASSAQAQVTFDSKFESSQNTGTASFSFVSNAGKTTGTVGSNTDRCLIGIAIFRGTAASVGTVTMTWATVNSFAQIGTFAITAGDNYSLFLFGLKGDANVTTGNQTLLVAWTGAHAAVTSLGAVSLYNCDPTTGWSDFTSATATSDTVTGTIPNVVAGDMSVAGLIDDCGSSTTITSPAVSDWNDRSSTAGNYNAGHRVDNGTIAWTLVGAPLWGWVGVRVIAASGGAGATSRLLLLGVGD